MYNFKEYIPSTRRLKDFFFLSSSQIFGFVTGLLVTILWTNFIDQDIYGKYNLILSIITITSLVCLGNIGMSANISAAKEKFGNFYKILKYKLIASIIGATLLIVVSLVSYPNITLPYKSLLLAAILFPLWSLTIAKDWLNGKKEFKNVAIIEIISKLTTLFGLFLVIYIFKIRTLNPLILVIFGIPVMINIATILYVYKNIIKHNIALTDNQIIRHGIHFSISSVIGILLLFDNILIAKYLSFKYVAIFSVAKLFPEQLKKSFSVLHRMIFPYFASFENLRQLWNWLKYRFVAAMIIFLLIGICGFFAIEILVPMFFSQKYAQAAHYGKWIFLVLSAISPCSLFNVALRTRIKYSRYLYLSTLISSLISLVCLWIFLPIWGLWGAVYARIFYIVLVSIFFVFSFIYYYKKGT